MLIEAAKNGACKTLKEAIKMVSDVVGNRRIDVQFGKTMSESVMRRWLITHIVEPVKRGNENNWPSYFFGFNPRFCTNRRVLKGLLFISI